MKVIKEKDLSKFERMFLAEHCTAAVTLPSRENDFIWLPDKPNAQPINMVIFCPKSKHELVEEFINQHAVETVNNWIDKEKFIDYLERQLIPDLKESNKGATAKDFETAVKFLRQETIDDINKRNKQYLDAVKDNVLSNFKE